MLLVLVTMPMQFLWAAMTPYCLHQPASRCGDHFGHHEHRHESKELRLLALMLQRPGEVLTRRELAEAVWEVRFDHGTNLIDVAIRRLRTKLDEPFERPLLHTVRGMGYVLEERED